MTTRTRTWILLAGLSALFVAFGGLVGGTGGLVVFLVLAVAFNFAMFWFSDRIALKMSRARPLQPGEAPDLVADVEDISARARIPVPRLYLIPSQQPNAFATGRDPKHSAVAVTEGLLALMPRDQVRGVLAHELAHIRNRDVLVTTIAAMIGAAISAIANFLQFQWLFGGDDDESPLGLVGTHRGDAGRADRGDAPPVRDLAPARAPRRPHGGRAARRGPLARERPRDAPARGGGGADAGQPGDGVALHREPALRQRHGVALLDAPADRRADRAPSPDAASRRARGGS